MLLLLVMGDGRERRHSLIAHTTYVNTNYHAFSIRIWQAG
jgi:hypothetical protein